jgi:hypothetical protein
VENTGTNELVTPNQDIVESSSEHRSTALLPVDDDVDGRSLKPDLDADCSQAAKKNLINRENFRETTINTDLHDCKV